ncbi:MAG: hypothetical protein JJE52_16205 [Acidimicrobiia bacterium]|nr:hypothetical protein [Acidimicrobiia bacterium]
MLAIGLVIAWGSVLVPPLLRLLGGARRPSDSIGSFRNNMSLLGNSGSAGGRDGLVLDLTAARASTSAARRNRQVVKKRRRDILVGLVVGATMALLAALTFGGIAWAVFALVAVALAGYVGLLWTAEQAALERRQKVTYFPHAERREAEPARLQRVGSSRG